jgi:hypothetical protein
MIIQIKKTTGIQFTFSWLVLYKNCIRRCTLTEQKTCDCLSHKERPSGGVFLQQFVLSVDVRPTSVKIGCQQLKILVIRLAPLTFKHYLKAYGIRTTIFGVSELKKSAGVVRPVAGWRLGNIFFLHWTIVFDTKNRPISIE